MDVETVIRAARAGDVGVPDLFHALAAADLLLATTADPGPDGVVEPFVFEWNGAPHAAIFTSAERTTGLPVAPAFTTVGGRSLGAGWPDDLRAIVNPGTDELMLVFDDVTVQLLAAPEDAVVLPPS